MRRLGVVTRAFAALVALVLLLAVVPLLAALVAGWPLPTAMPSLAEVGDALTRTGVPDTVVVKAVAVIVWLAWIQLVVAVVAEAVAVARARPVRRLPGLGPTRHLAASLVAAVVALSPMTGLAAGSEAPPAPISLPVGVAAANEVPDPAPAHLTSVVTNEAVDEWVVRPRDTLWRIAEVALGRGERWREIQQLNSGREVAPGVVFPADSDLLRAGWRLRIPRTPARRAVAPVVAPTPAPVVTPAVPVRMAPRVEIGSAVRMVNVEPGDTLVGLARRWYGDAGAWRQIWEANRGRTIAGRVFDDPNRIYVGWDLLLPPGDGAPTRPHLDHAPGGGPAAATLAADVGAGTVTVATSTPRASEVAPPSVLPAPPTPAPVAAETDVVPAEVPPTIPNTPPTPPPIATSVARSRPAASRPNEAPVPAAAPDDEARDPSAQWALTTGFAAATLIATGLAGVITARRRRRMERMTPAEELPIPDPDLAPTERAVRLGDDPLAVARIDAALRAFAALARRDGLVDARPVAVRRLASGDLDVLLAEPAPAPVPFIGDHGDAVWYLPAGVPLSEIAALLGGGVASPCPALVLLGVGGGAEVYLDLEAVGTVVLEGPPAAARAIARAVVAALAVSPLAERVTVVAAGVDCYGFSNEERVESVDDAAAALELAGRLVGPMRRALDAAGACSTFALRATRADELWEPTVVVHVGGRGDADLRRLQDLVGSGGQGLALLTDAPTLGASWSLSLRPTGWQLAPLGVDLVAHGLGADELADAGALLADAGAAPVQTAATADSGATLQRFVEPPWELLVRLLGPVDVIDRQGVPAAFERSKALELVVWLAQHRSRPTRSGARTSLWDGNVRDATFANVVSDARRNLARLVAPAGDDEWIGRTYAEDLPLHPLVLTDAELLAARLEHARRQSDHDAVATLREGLELVRGLPYTGTSYLWPDGEALPSYLTLVVIHAATEMATRCLGLGDADSAFWATAQGMRVLPAHDELVSLRLRAHAVQGNLAGVRHEYESYERAVLADPWSDGEPSPKVVAVRNELLHAARAV